jgi:hypothetical protein
MYQAWPYMKAREAISWSYEGEVIYDFVKDPKILRMSENCQRELQTSVETAPNNKITKKDQGAKKK